MLTSISSMSASVPTFVNQSCPPVTNVVLRVGVSKNDACSWKLSALVPRIQPSPVLLSGSSPSPPKK
ncbi:MAG: hypothetical protein AAFP15_04550 [Bacteroidota bacterium]